MWLKWCIFENSNCIRMHMYFYVRDSQNLVDRPWSKPDQTLTGLVSESYTLHVKWTCAFLCYFSFEILHHADHTCGWNQIVDILIGHQTEFRMFLRSCETAENPVTPDNYTKEMAIRVKDKLGLSWAKLSPSWILVWLKSV